MLRQGKASADPGHLGCADAVVRAMLPYTRGTVQDLRRALGMAPRTLEEHLQAQASSFQRIRDGTRGSGRVLPAPIAQVTSKVADVLGYAELSVLSRCFRRWHDIAARQWRTPARAREGRRGGLNPLRRCGRHRRPVSGR